MSTQDRQGSTQMVQSLGTGLVRAQGWLLSLRPLLLPWCAHQALRPARTAVLGVSACSRHDSHHPSSASGHSVTDLFTLYKTPSSSMPSRWMEKKGDISSAGRYGAASLGRKEVVRGLLLTPHPVIPQHSTMPQHPSKPGVPCHCLPKGLLRFHGQVHETPKAHKKAPSFLLQPDPA